MIKAVFFDMDGTIYSHKTNCVPESTRIALDTLRENGVMVFLATGRHFVEIEDFPVGKMNFDGYVMLNGQICTDSDRKIVFGNPIEGKDSEYLLNAFNNKEIPIMIVEKDQMYMNLVDEMVVKGQAEISTPIPEIQEYEGAPIFQFICYGGKELEERLASILEKCKITRWCPFGIDIISKTGGKVTGIKKMLEHYGVTEQEIIAFGDAENDLDMIEFAGIGVAMGNAKDEVKAVADYVTTDVDENGIWNACKYFGLI